MPAASYLSEMAWGVAPQGADLTADTTLAFATAGAVVSAAALARWRHLSATSRALLQGVNAQGGNRTITITAPAADNTVSNSRIVLTREDATEANTLTVTLSAGTFETEEVKVGLTDPASITIPVGGWVILERVNGSARPKVVAGSGLPNL